MSIFFYFFLYIFLVKLSHQEWRFFPEDFSSIDYLTNPENENEIHLLSYSADSTPEKYFDFRNGINIYTIRGIDLFNDKCGSTSEYYTTTPSYLPISNDLDKEWDVNNMNIYFFPPKTNTYLKYFIYSNYYSFILISPLTFLYSSYDSINNRKFTEELYQNNNIIFNYYIWFSPIDDITNLIIGCMATDICSVTDNNINYGSFAKDGIYQIYFQVQNDKIKYKDNQFNCIKTDDFINLIIYHRNIRIYQIKITYQILSDISCDTNDNCPPGTLCNFNTRYCQKCDGRYSICKDIAINSNGEYESSGSSSTLECSRFTKQWKNPNQRNCEADYFNINKLNYISFEMFPIKTGAASVSFWFYSIKPDSSSNGILHIVLSDYMVCTIIVESNKYKIYVTGYELYHEAYGIKISDIQNKIDFLSAINTFPYIKWNINEDLNKFDRWINIRFSFNMHKGNNDNSKITLFIQYNKYSMNSDPNPENINLIKSLKVPNEYIYGIDGTSPPENEIHFKKFYRTNDLTYLKVLNYNFEKQIYIKNLYVFGTELLASDGNTISNYLKGFQYYAFEEIFDNSKFFPELFLACPFDSIYFDSSDNSYNIQYYIYNINDDSYRGIKTEKIVKIKVSENIDNVLYSYYPKLYRLYLITEKNKIFTNNDLISDLFTLGNHFYYDLSQIFSCFDEDKHLTLYSRTCENTCNGKYNVARGLNYNINKRGICTYTCDMNCNNIYTYSTNCPSNYFALFDICMKSEAKYVSSSERGSLYYSYFFNLPPIKITLPKQYEQYYLKFNFRYETNRVLRVGNPHKGHKIYIFYTDCFRIWHDYNFNYIGIEDNNGNNGKNLRPYFNIDNKNLFKIKVYKGSDNNYYGNIYLNNNLDHSVDFNAGKLHYLYFCHNDTNCVLSDGKNVYWTSGFYDNIRIYDASNSLINDAVIYNLHLYEDIYPYYIIYYSKPILQLNFLNSDEIPLTFSNINNNYLNVLQNSVPSSYTGYSFDFIYDIRDIQAYNYNDFQDIPFRTKDNTYANRYTGSDGSIQTCQYGKACYGSGTNDNPFSQECSVCDDSNYYYRFSNCYNFLHQYYYVLPFPFITKNTNGFSNTEVEINLSSVYNDRFTIFFYLKLLGFRYPYSSEVKIVNFDNQLFIYYDVNSNILKFKNNIDQITVENYPKEYFGKYIPISISYFDYCPGKLYENSNYHKYFISIQVNNKDCVPNYTPIGMSFGKIVFYPNEFYGTIANFHLYNQVLIGAYAFETNKQYQTPIIPYVNGIQVKDKIVDETSNSCLKGNNNIVCVNDYDVLFNKNNYPEKGFPNDKKIYNTKNDAYTIEDCSDSCGSFCYNKEHETSCACTNIGINDYLEKDSNGIVKCKKLEYYDIQRIKEVYFTNLPVDNTNGGWRMWFLVNYDDYYTIGRSGDDCGVKIQYCSGIVYLNPRQFNPYGKMFAQHITKVWRYFEFNIPLKRILYRIPGLYSDYFIEPTNFSMSSYQMTYDMNISFNYFNESVGLIFIRQIQIWTNFNEIINRDIEIKDTIKRTGFGAVIDTLVNKNQVLTVKSSNNLARLSNIIYKSVDTYEFGYYPLTEGSFTPLTLYNEYDKRDKFSLRLNAFNDFTIENIPPSISNSYTIEMWLRIIKPKNLISGINVIWEKHIAISIINDQDIEKLTYICFPQDYLTSPKGKKGREVINTMSEAFNSDKFEVDLNQYDKRWVNVRCAFNWINELYYLQGFDVTHEPIYEAVEKNVIKENTYLGQKVDYPYKYYFYDTNSKIIIQNQQSNQLTEINIRNVYLYNEYLLPNFNTIRVKFSSSKFISSLIFGVDLEYLNNNKIKIFDQRDETTMTLTPVTSPLYTIGLLELCEPNTQKYDKNNIKCDSLSIDEINNFNTLNAEIYYDIYILQCKTNYYLNIETNRCIQNQCPTTSLNLSPWISKEKGSCSFRVDENHIQITSPYNYKTTLLCKNGYTRVGYKCLPTAQQEKSSFYFNHCYNFLPAYQRFTTAQLEQTKNGYVVEFWFKLDKVNEFCGNNKNRYVLWVYPHSLFQYANDDTVYYKDLFLSSNTPIKLNNIHLYEWNFVLFEYRKSKGKVNIWVNFKSIEPDHSFNIQESYINSNAYNVKAFAFCNGDYYCAPIESISIDWSSAYYSRMRVYDISSSSVYMVMENALEKVISQPKNIIIFYIFNTVNNDLNLVYDENYPTLTTKALNINDNLKAISPYRVEDVMLLFSSTSNFDWGEINEGKYIISQEIKTGKINSGLCSIHCKRCYSSSENDCYECFEGYVLYYSGCRQRTGYYPQIPESLNNYIVPNLNKNGFEIDKYNPLTISFWIKFYGIKYNNLCTDIKSNCVLIIQISIQNKVYLCYDTNNNHILLYYNDDTILYDDSLFPLEAGKWVLLSFSNYNSNFNIDTTSYYPLMFSFSFNSYTVPRANTYQINDPGILIDTIIFGCGISASFTDLRIYNTFILNPYGIITNDESYQKLLVYNLKLYDMTQSCIPIYDLYDINGNELSGLITCKSDYNIYHDMSNINCNENKYKRVDYISLNNECVDCIDECYYCGGETKLNCACYYNDIYWFRNDITENRLYCQKIPYQDFNIYSELQFTNISYATTNEYSIEFWYFIYEYVKENHIFNEQSIQWTDHNKIVISKKDDNNVYVDCYPIQNHDDSIVIRDSSQGYFQWHHVICSTSLTKSKYYLNELPVKSLDKSKTNYIDFSYFGETKTRLIFKNKATHTSHGLFFIRELRLWSIYSLREFPSNCAYNSEYTKNNNINFLLHYYPFPNKNDGLIYDSKGNQPTIKQVKDDIIGFNIIDYENLYTIIYDFDECLIVMTIPSFGYFNLTHFYLKAYLETPLSTVDPSSNPIYTFSFYISEDAEKIYPSITTGQLDTEGLNNLTPNEVLIAKLTDSKFNNSNINIYVTETNPITGITKIGFGRIKVIDYSNVDINFKPYLTGFDDDISVDSNDLSSKVIISNEQIWNRIITLSSLADTPYFVFNSVNMTESELNYIIKEDSTLDKYSINGINITNPICSQNFCSNRGDCYIIVRGSQCYCYDGYTGINCQMTTNNKEIIVDYYEKYWNYLTNNNDLSTFSSTDFTNDFVLQINYLVRSAMSYSKINSDIIIKYYGFFDFIYRNYQQLIIDNYLEFLWTFDYLTVNLYKNINKERLTNFITNTTSTTNNDIIEENKILEEMTSRRILKVKNEEDTEEKYPEDLVDYNQNVIFNKSLTKNQIITNYEYSLKIIEYIRKIISLEIKNFREDLYLAFQGIDISVVSVTEEFNYTRFFTNKFVENQDKKFYFKSYIDASLCSSHVFEHTSYTNLFLVQIQYRYDPLSFYSTYSTSSSFLNDIFFMDQNGEIISLSDCSNNYTIYFPLNLYNRTKTKLLIQYADFQSKNLNIGPKHPYVTWPVYVYKNGTVCKKSREERIKEVYQLLKFNCTYYDYELKITERNNNGYLDSNFFLNCPVHHLGLYSIEIYDNNEKYKIANIFFYLEAYRIFKYTDNFLILSFYIYAGLFIMFILSILFIGLYDYCKTQRKKDLLDEIKTTIIRENLFYENIEEIKNNLYEANKFHLQDEIAKELNIRKQNEKVSRIKYGEKGKINNDKDTETNTKFTNISTQNITNKNKKKSKKQNEENIENQTNSSKYKYGNPPKKKEYEESSSENNSESNSENNSESNSENKSLSNKISIEEVNIKDLYQVKDYNNLNKSDNKESSFGFIDDFDTQKKSEKSVKPKKKRRIIKKEESDDESYNIENAKRLNYFNSESELNKIEPVEPKDEKDQKDYLSKFNVINKNSNYISNEMTIVRNLDTRINVPDIFDDIESKKISFIDFFCWSFIKRNIYFSIFSVKSTLNPKWKRIFILYIYLILQYLFGTIYLTFVERINLSKILKIIIIHPCVLITSNLIIYGVIWFFRVENYNKLILLNTLRSSQQMKLIAEWKKMKKRQSRKMIGGFSLFLIFFIVTFYFFFTYTVVVYMSRNTFILNFTVGLILDIFIYEGFMNLLLSIFYSNRNKLDFKRFFLFRAYRNCL